MIVTFKSPVPATDERNLVSGYTKPRKGTSRGTRRGLASKGVEV